MKPRLQSVALTGWDQIIWSRVSTHIRDRNPQRLWTSAWGAAMDADRRDAALMWSMLQVEVPDYTVRHAVLALHFGDPFCGLLRS